MEFHGLASVAIRHRRTNAALGAMLLLLPSSASAQGTLEDYRRASTINQRFANLTTGLVQGETWLGKRTWRSTASRCRAALASCASTRSSGANSRRSITRRWRGAYRV